MRRLFISIIICFNFLYAQPTEVETSDFSWSTFNTQEKKSEFPLRENSLNYTTFEVFEMEEIGENMNTLYDEFNTPENEGENGGNGGGSAEPIGDAIPFMLLLGAIYSFVCYRRNR